MSAATKELTPAEYQALLTGLPKYCASQVFLIANQSFTAAQAVVLITAILNASAATATAKAAWKDAEAAENATLATNGPLVKAIRDTIALTFSNVLATLTAFGIEPRKVPKPLTGEARAAATAKANATREARGTESKKKKALVSGNVTGVNITPITAPATQAPAVTPPVAASPSTTGSAASSPAAPVTATPATTPHS